MSLLITPAIVIVLLAVYVLFIVYAERKIAAAIQDRLGPYEVGPKGLLQTVADMIKLLQKEDLAPLKTEVIVFKAAPIFLFVVTFLAFSLLPYHTLHYEGNVLLILLAFLSLNIIGFLFAGFSGVSRYPFLGSLRAISQMVAYEVPMTIVMTSVVLISGSLDLRVIENLQESSAGVLSWNIFKYPVLFIGLVIFFISSLAESNRAPFDLPEGESELVAGYNTEYSGFRWSLFFFVEYEEMLLFSLLIVIMFLGGGSSPFPDVGNIKLHSWTSGVVWKYFWWFFKSLPFLFLQLWIRWTFPRFRPDKLIIFSWIFLIPVSVFVLLLIVLLI